jgi:predicted nuclease of predicted toxin-antitoxin system
VSVRLYFDVQVPSAIADGLRLRSVDVLRAQEDGASEFADPQLLDRATELGRVLFTQDKDFLREARRRHQSGKTFAGIIYVHQLALTIGECITDLEIIAKDTELDEWVDHVEYMPL